MSDAITNAKSWELGSVRKNKNGKVYIAFDKNVKILVGDREVDMGEYNVLYLNDALEQAQFLLTNKHITQDQFSDRVKSIETKGIKSVLKANLS